LRLSRSASSKRGREPRAGLVERLVDAPLKVLQARVQDGSLRLGVRRERLNLRAQVGLGVSDPPLELGDELVPLVLEGVADLGELALEALAADHTVAALLVRLGGYAAGVFDGERLVASKVGSRFVKNRHKKGGSSANRFRRRREEQARALIDEAAEVAVRVLEPWRGRVEFVALGGDRAAIREVLAASPQLGWLAERQLPRFFDVPEPRQRVLEQLPYDLYSAELTTEPTPTR
jgi:hypothetical protein